jgi:hypothetical protein
MARFATSGRASRGRLSEFEGGVIVWTPEGGAQVRVRIDDP